ncbi:hypothetical protein Bca101_025496 [Brassica carinata]
MAFISSGQGEGSSDFIQNYYINPLLLYEVQSPDLMTSPTSLSSLLLQSSFSVNTKGAFLCSKEAANRLKQGGGGRIILLTSSMTRGLKPGFGAYAASKAAVETMVKILAKELKGTGITANCVAPGTIATEMFYEGKSSELVEKIAAENTFGRVGEVKDVVPLVGFFASDGGEWINGQIIPVNGGYV